jgi:hypothetical protein
MRQLLKDAVNQTPTPMRVVALEEGDGGTWAAR